MNTSTLSNHARLGASALAILFGVSVVQAQPPDGWIKAGNKPQSYEVGLDSSTFKSGDKSCYMKSTERKIDGFGTVMQSILPDDYRGERVRLSGYLKTKDAKGWVGLWMRVDGEERNKSLAFDNMQSRPLKGTTEWTKCDVVLEVDKSATNVSFGFLMNGVGKVWADGLVLEIVDRTVSTTDMMSKGLGKKRKAQNLDFDQ